jgi:hypothetical protein
MTDLDEEFESAPARAVYGLTSENENGGRYRYPAPPDWTGTPPRRSAANPLGLPDWMRMTNLVGAFSDQERLQLWMTWRAMMGFRQADGVLWDEWATEDVERLDAVKQSQLANRYAERARQAHGADSAARRGTARHKMMDTWLTEARATGTRSMRQQLASALEALEAHGLEVVRSEFKVWHEAAGGTMGTSDVEVMDTRSGELGILDWKTQAKFWTWQEICGQLYGYDSAKWRWDGPPDPSGGWVAAESHTLTGRSPELLGKRVALVAHMPQAPGPGQLPVEIWEVDLEYGHRVLDIAAENVRLRSIGRSQKVGRRPANRRPFRA